MKWSPTAHLIIAVPFNLQVRHISFLFLFPVKVILQCFIRTSAPRAVENDTHNKLAALKPVVFICVWKCRGPLDLFSSGYCIFVTENKIFRGNLYSFFQYVQLVWKDLPLMYVT